MSGDQKPREFWCWMWRKAELAIERNLRRSFSGPLGYGSDCGRLDQEAGANHLIVCALLNERAEACDDLTVGFGVSDFGEILRSSGFADLLRRTAAAGAGNLLCAGEEWLFAGSDGDCSDLAMHAAAPGRESHASAGGMAFP
jgi:hypothetical protein